MGHSVPQAKLQRFIEASHTMKSDPDYPIFEVGRKQGREEMRVKALSFLQDKYLKDANRPDRGTPEANAILKLARELSIHLQVDEEN